MHKYSTVKFLEQKHPLQYIALFLGFFFLNLTGDPVVQFVIICRLTVCSLHRCAKRFRCLLLKSLRSFAFFPGRTPAIHHDAGDNPTQTHLPEWTEPACPSFGAQVNDMQRKRQCTHKTHNALLQWAANPQLLLLVHDIPHVCFPPGISNILCPKSIRWKRQAFKLQSLIGNVDFAFSFWNIAYLELLFWNLSDHPWRIWHSHSQRFFLSFSSFPLILGFWPCVLEANLCLYNCSHFFTAITFFVCFLFF